MLISLLILGIATVTTNNLLRTVIYSGAFSLVMALAFLYYNAPDVALAEAAIGVGLSTIMYLVSLKKIRVYDICYVDESVEEFDDDNINAAQDRVLRPLEYFIERTEELEPQLAYSNQDIQSILDNDHDVIIHQQDELIYFYGKTTDTVFQDIVANMNEYIGNMDDIRIVYLDQEVSWND